MDKIFSSKEKRNKFFQLLFFLIIIFILLYVLTMPFHGYFTNRNKLKNLILGYGNFAPVILISIQILQVLIAPIPGQAVGFVGGYIFGAIKGTIYSMTGVMIGSFIAVLLARRFGRPFVERMVKGDTLKKFDYISGKRGAFALFWIFLLPLFPDDAVCFIAGITKIRLRVLIIIIFLGRLPGFLVLSMAGSGFAKANSTFSILLFAAFMLVSIVVFFYKERLEKISRNLIYYYFGN